jgi:hypothetical protein
MYTVNMSRNIGPFDPTGGSKSPGRADEILESHPPRATFNIPQQLSSIQIKHEHASTAKATCREQN